jgi:hypothetical protein
MVVGLARSRVLLAAIALLISACATQRPGDDAPVARPEVRAGERWTYRAANRLLEAASDSYEVVVTFARSDVIQGILTWQGETPEADVTWTAEWNAVVSATEGMGLFDRVGAFDPHFGLFKFPLRIGSSWKSAYEIHLPRRNDLRVRHERRVSVVGYEEVVVPAGKFRALKVVAEGTYQHLGFARRSGSTRTVSWYVPEVKRWVKLTHDEFEDLPTPMFGPPRGETTRPAIRREDELVSFELAAQP